MTIEIPDDDPVRTYSEEEARRLSDNLLELNCDTHQGYGTRELDVALLCELHRRLFETVRSHAGRHRRADFGQEHIIFGPVRSPNRAQVPRLLTELMASTSARLRVDFSGPPSEADFVARIELVAETHARFISIHPFEDGNGRTGRALMSLMLVRLGLRPIPIEASKHEYYLVLNEYHHQKNLRPLVDLLLRLYPT